MKSIHDKHRVVIVCCGLLFIYGTYLGTIQTVIDAIGRSLSLSSANLGMIVSVQYIPVAFMPAIMGGVSDRIGRKPVITTFCIVFSVGLAACGSAHSSWVLVLGIFAVGAGFSVCEAVCCAAFSDLGEDWGVRGINLSQAMLCLGAVLSPMLIRASNIAWRGALYLCTSLGVLAIPLVLRVRFPVNRASGTDERGDIRALLASSVFLLLFTSIFLYIGLESGFGYSIEGLISGRFGRTALSCISLYWLGMMISRLLFASIRYSAKPVLIGGFLASAMLFLALIKSNAAWTSLAMCFLTGFAYGPIWSTLLSEATARYPVQAGTVSGLMSAGCGIGGIVFPTVMGLSIQYFSLTGSFYLLCILALIGGIMCSLLPRK